MTDKQEQQSIWEIDQKIGDKCVVLSRKRDAGISDALLDLAERLFDTALPKLSDPDIFRETMREAAGQMTSPTNAKFILIPLTKDDGPDLLQALEALGRSLTLAGTGIQLMTPFMSFTRQEIIDNHRG